MIDTKIEKKPVYSMKNLILFFVQLCVLVLLILCLIIFIKIPVSDLNKFSPINLASVQTSISLISITIMQLILPDRKERVFGVTYQQILFKWKILKYFNALDCTMYMLLLMIINISLSVVSVITNNDIQNICKMCFMCIMLETSILAVYMIYLGLITKFKKSRIYFLLYKRISKRNTQSNEVYNKLLKGIGEHSYKFTKKNCEYLSDEIKILKYMLNYMNEFSLYNMDTDKARKLIKNEIHGRNKAIAKVKKHVK